MYRFYTVILFFSMIPSQARLSETMQQCITRYGPASPILGVPILTGYTEALFEKNGIKLIAAFKGDVCSQETFWNSDGKDLSSEEIYGLLSAESKGSNWIAGKNPTIESYNQMDGTSAIHLPKEGTIQFFSKQFTDDAKGRKQADLKAKFQVF